MDLLILIPIWAVTFAAVAVNLRAGLLLIQSTRWYNVRPVTPETKAKAEWYSARARRWAPWA